MTTDSKFALHNFKGSPIRFFRCDAKDLNTSSSATAPKPSHHVLVVDRSGSMYSDISDMRTTVEKLLTLSEFRDAEMKISLISYSSKGDVKLHFSKIKVADVMKADSPHLKAIRSIQATSMTCISQGLVMAETLVDDKDVTCITLHTDGYANDLSPSQEQRDIKTAVDALKKHPSLFCNTIGYRENCDYNLLSSISNALSGSCIQAKGIRQVYESIYNSSKLLAGAMSPVVEIPRGQASYVMFVSRSARKVLGSSDQIQVRGLSPSDDKMAYRLTEIDAQSYGSLKLPVNGEGESFEPIMAFARTQVAEGNLNAAKYALVTSRCPAMLDHTRALVTSDVAALADCVETHLFDQTVFQSNPNYGLGATGPSVLEVLTYLNAQPSITVNLTDLVKVYKRRGIKRVPGTRQADGSLEVPTVSSKVRDGDGWVKVNSFELNRNTATINMLVSQPIDLFPKGSSTRVASVAGVQLNDLKSFNNYTIVGDGSLNVSQLNLRTSDVRVIQGLLAMGAPIGNAVVGQPFTLDLSGLPLVDYDLNVSSVGVSTVKHLAQLTVLGKILNGMVKGDPSGYTPEQVTELKGLYLTPALNFSPPMTTEYADLKAAIASGKVDTKLSYKVNLGTTELTSISKLKSGNEYLGRRFTLTFLGKDVEKPTLDSITLPSAVWGIKKLTARTQLDTVDEISYPIYEGVLGLGDGTELKALLTSIGCVSPDKFLSDIRSEHCKDAVKDAIRVVDDAIESVYTRIRPLAFFVGAAGMVPDTLGAKAMTVEEFGTAYPDVKLSKAEKDDGSFYVLPDKTVLTVFVEAENFSV